MAHSLDVAISQEEIATLIAPLAEGSRDKFFRALVGAVAGVGGSISKEAALAVFDKLHTNDNDRIFSKFLADERDLETRLELVGLIRAAVEDVVDESRVAVIRVLHSLGAELELQFREVDHKLGQLAAASGRPHGSDGPGLGPELAAACCAWLPPLSKLDRTALDVIESDAYINRSPSSLDDLARQIGDVNRSLRLFNASVDAVRHTARSQRAIAAGKPQDRAWEALERAIQVAQQIARHDEYAAGRVHDPSLDLRQTHKQLARSFDDLGRRLTKEREALSVWLNRFIDEAHRRLNVGVQPSGASPAAAGSFQLLVRGLPRYFTSVERLVGALRACFDAGELPTASFANRAEHELTPLALDLNETVACVHDHGLSGVIELALSGRSSHSAVCGLLELVNELMMFHKDRVRDILNRTLVSMYEAEQDPSASLADCFALARQVLIENDSAFSLELPDYAKRTNFALAALPPSRSS
jgi:hypothetical protein